MIIEIFNQTEEQMTELLGKAGISQESIKPLAYFIATMGKIYEVLISSGMPEFAARQHYEVSMIGFLQAYPSIRLELNTLAKDKERLKILIRAVAESNAETAFKQAELNKTNPVKENIPAPTVYETDPKLH